MTTKKEKEWLNKLNAVSDMRLIMDKINRKDSNMKTFKEEIVKNAEQILYDLILVEDLIIKQELLDNKNLRNQKKIRMIELKNKCKDGTASLEEVCEILA